jgi:hypothetical protein
MCSLSAGRKLPHSGHRYVAGLRFWARRTSHQRGVGALAIVQSMAPHADRSPLSSASVEQRDERIILETDRHRITGLLRLPADGYRSRLTDYLNSAEREFLALTDVEVTSLQGNPRVEQREFIALSLRHIVLAMPAEGNVTP